MGSDTQRPLTAALAVQGPLLLAWVQLIGKTSGSGHAHQVHQTCRQLLCISAAVHVRSHYGSEKCGQCANTSGASAAASALDRKCQSCTQWLLASEICSHAADAPHHRLSSTLAIRTAICMYRYMCRHMFIQRGERGILLGLAAPGVSHQQSSVIGQQDVLHLLLCCLIHICHIHSGSSAKTYSAGLALTYMGL